jgi:hypothetical protein
MVGRNIVARRMACRNARIKRRIYRTAIAPMNHAAARVFAANAWPIIAGIENCPPVISRLRLRGRMIGPWPDS